MGYGAGNEKGTAVHGSSLEYRVLCLLTAREGSPPLMCILRSAAKRLVLPILTGQRAATPLAAILADSPTNTVFCQIKVSRKRA